MRKLLTMLILLLLPLLVYSQGHLVRTYESLAGESSDEFILRIAGPISNMTRIYGYEYCGEVSSRGDRYLVYLYTSRQSDRCVFHRFDKSSDIVHTHPYYARPVFGDDDYKHSGYLIIGRRVYYQSGRGTERRLR